MVSVTCEVIGDYHIIDHGNGLYQVWYVNPYADTDDVFVSEHETMYSARMNAVCARDVDDIIMRGVRDASD
jgi:hypothetical protein